MISSLRGCEATLDQLGTEPNEQAGGVRRWPSVVDQGADQHVIVPDLHGEYKVLEKILDVYGDNPNIDFVFLGDLLDRNGLVNDSEKGVYKTLDLIKELGSRAVVTIGNHEWVFLASTLSGDVTFREVAARNWLGTDKYRGAERNVLTSYDLKPGKHAHDTAKKLQRSMEAVGHMAVLASTVPYYETDSFIAVHAGVDPQISWDDQKDYLADVTDMMRLGFYREKPDQWFSKKLATSIKPILHTDKIVVTGHAHNLAPTKKKKLKGLESSRVINNGKRVRLASSLNAPVLAPAFVWQDWDGEIVRLSRDEQY